MISLFTPASIVLVLPRMFSEDPRFLFIWGEADKGAALSTCCLVFQTMCMGVFFLFLCAVDWTWRLVGRRIEKTGVQKVLAVDSQEIHDCALLPPAPINLTIGSAECE